MAKPLGRRRIRNVFGVPPSALPRDTSALRPRPPRVDPGFDIDAVRLKPPPRRRRR